MFYNEPRVKAFIDRFMPRIHFCRILCAIGALSSLFSPLQASEPDTLDCNPLQELEVVGKAVPSPLVSSSPLQVMERDAFLRNGALSLADAVKRMTGVDVHDYGGVGGLKTVSVRGLGAKHTAVSYDGLVLSNAQSGHVDIGRLSLENMSMAALSLGYDGDIFRSATEYMSSSLLTLSTLRPSVTNSSVRLRAGSFGLVDAMLRHSQCFGDGWSASLQGSFMRSGGRYPFLLSNGANTAVEKREESDVMTFGVEGNLFGRLFGGDLAVKLNFFDSERGLPGAVNLYNKENKERLWDDNFYAQASYERRMNRFFTLKARLKYDFQYTRYKNISANYASGEQEDVNSENSCYASVGVKYLPFGSLSLALTSDISYTTLCNNFNDSRQPRRLSSLSVFAARYDLGRFSATASLLATYIKDNVSHGAAPSPFFRFSPSVALSVQPFAGVPFRLRASYKDCCRVPTFTDLYYLRLGNVGLKPERASQFNFGATWSVSFGGVVEYLSIIADGYYNRVYDKIVALPTMYVWKMFNSGEAEIAGLDASAEVQLDLSHGMRLQLDAGYSFQHAVDISDPAAKNYRHQLPYTPLHSGKLTLSFLSSYVNVSYIFTAVGERYVLPQNTQRNRIEGYAEHSFSANREFRFGRYCLQLQGELLNVGNKQYEIIKFYPMPGFQWRLSALFSF